MKMMEKLVVGWLELTMILMLHFLGSPVGILQEKSCRAILAVLATHQRRNIKKLDYHPEKNKKNRPDFVLGIQLKLESIEF